MTDNQSEIFPDLHCHSFYSDGKHSPEHLLQRAQQNRLTHLAITDHDCVTDCTPLKDKASGIQLISGVEISCAWQLLEIHVLGLCINPSDPNLGQLLTSQQRERRSRMRDMDRQLQALGKTGLGEYLESLPCVAYTRSHVADFLVAQGICKSRQKAFKTHLGKKGRIYTAPNWCSLEDTIDAIVGAGGIAVLAHPGRYPLSKRKLELLVEAFVLAGGEALEVSYGNIQPDVRQHLSNLAVSKDLFCSAGSDFHDAEATWTDLGKFPALDAAAKKNAIWLHPRWHS